MAEKQALIKLEGEVYHVDKTKMEQVLSFLVSLPFNQVGGILEGLVAFKTNQDGANNAAKEESQQAASA
jgi:hypothetical protein